MEAGLKGASLYRLTGKPYSTAVGVSTHLQPRATGSAWSPSLFMHQRLQ
jgi:hypothetical protein